MSSVTWEKPSKALTKIIEGYNVNGFEAPGGTDKNTIHNYTGIYEHILSPYVKQEGQDRKSTRLNSSHSQQSRMPSSA